ncbi:MAG: tetratricopeptide repeat protein [Chitinophagales bacterium]|nr:tetratricopeptide repeat protein [Chitinophagales bacterium]
MKLALIILNCLVGIWVYGFDSKATMANGHKAFAEKHYKEAAEHYQMLVDSGYQSAALYYNLGTSYFKAGAVAASILYLEKAKALSPSDEDINYNLQLANLRVVTRIEPAPQLRFVKATKEFISKYTSNTWGIMTLVLLWLALAAYFVLIVGKDKVPKRVLQLMSLVLLIASFATLIFGIKKRLEEDNGRFAIVFATNSYVKSAPDTESVDLFILREGVKIRLLETLGEWEKIKVPDARGDKVGWIPRSHFKTI